MLHMMKKNETLIKRRRATPEVLLCTDVHGKLVRCGAEMAGLTQ
jgi:hypothetical protein